jgi:hypothetical protein
MIDAIWNRLKQNRDFNLTREKPPKKVTVEASASYPTESAERAKEQRKKNKEAGIKPKRKPVHVESHFDDLGDDLSGLGDDAAFLTADVTRSDWTDEESDEEANSLVHNLFGPNQMNTSNIYEMHQMFHTLSSTEPLILKLSANHDSAMATLEVRKYQESVPVDVKTQLQITDMQQIGELCKYAKTQPILMVMMETLPHHDASHHFGVVASYLSKIQVEKEKSFVFNTEKTRTSRKVTRSCSFGNVTIVS